MTQTFWAFPAIDVKDRSRVKSRSRRDGKGPTKYNHWAMLRDRLDGLSFHDIEQKYGVPSLPHRGEAARRLLARCNASKALSASEIARIFPGSAH